MTNTNEKYLVGVYDDEEVLLNAIAKVRSSGVKTAWTKHWVTKEPVYRLQPSCLA
jgi:hypothetical protein